MRRRQVEYRVVQFDTVIIGGGLIGSAAAQHLGRAGELVALVGPDEPADAGSAVVFASHYDSGRVQRRVGHNDAMTRLNLLALEHYDWLQQESGIPFHGGAGCLYVDPVGRNPYLDEAPGRAARFGVDVEVYQEARALATAFPEMRFPAASRGLYEATPSGHIDPRRLVKAQLRIVERGGGLVVRDVVERLVHRAAGIEVHTREGKAFHGRKVLLSMGAFSRTSGLTRRRLALTIKSETVLLARVSREEARRLESMPSLLYDIDVPALEGIYAVAPVRYPDGHFYLKMGCNLPEDRYFEHELSHIQEWFRSGDSDAHLEKMREALATIMPHARFDGFLTKRCILTRTASHGNPYIGQVDKDLYVAIGNGWSAMCSDGIGRVAAHLMREGAFPDGFRAVDFEPVFAERVT